MKICPACRKTYTDDFTVCLSDGARLTAQAAETEAQLAAGLSRRFRLVRRLGQGDMGTVFLAEQIEVGNRPVALKVLNRKFLDDRGFLPRFQNEMESTGRIHHPNVVTIYESAQGDDGTPYIAMEFLEGESLSQALKRRRALPVTEVAEILQQAAEGLDAAHKLGIIHRDLKPDNIFLTQGGQGELVVKLLDFGIAKLRESAMHTQTGVVLGTPAYISSEQAWGKRSDELDARCDIYSLGVVAYEMLTGRVPFQSDTPFGCLYMHMLEAPPPFKAVAKGLSVPPRAEAVVMKALKKEREERYQSAVEFARAFVAAALPAPATEVSQPPPSTKIVVSLAVRESDAPVPLPAITQAKVDTAVQTAPPASPERNDETPAAQPQEGEPVASASRPPEPAKADTAVQTPALAPPGRIAETPTAQPQEGEPVAAASQPPEPAKADTPVQTAPPAPAETIVKPPAAPLQGSKPSPAKPPWLRKAPEPPRKMKFVVIAVAALILIVSGAWYFSRQRSKKENVSSSTKGEPSQGKVRINPKDGLTYVLIRPGTFMMGCSMGDAECEDDEKPPHLVTMTKGFWLGQTEVTVGAYRRFAGATGRQLPPQPKSIWRQINPGGGDEAMPIVDVTWDDAQAYCTWEGGRLPTEAEWEYAARGGSTASRYGDVDEIAWYADNSGRQRLDSEKISKEDQSNYGKHLDENGNNMHEVGQKRPNALRLYDMLGNVGEWVNDWYAPAYYENSPSQDPKGPESGSLRILRGGSWVNRPGLVRVSLRNGLNPAYGNLDVGFRCGGDVFAPMQEKTPPE